jgi:anti-anti-sigma factor
MDMEKASIGIDFRGLHENPLVTVATINGALDSYTSRHFQDALTEHIQREQSRLILDCEGLTYLSSAGIGSFFVLSEKLQEDGFIVLCGLRPDVLRILTMVGASEYFDICSTYEEAVEKALDLLDHTG